MSLLEDECERNARVGLKPPARQPLSMSTSALDDALFCHAAAPSLSEEAGRRGALQAAVVKKFKARIEQLEHELEEARSAAAQRLNTHELHTSTIDRQAARIAELEALATTHAREPHASGGGGGGAWQDQAAFGVLDEDLEVCRRELRERDVEISLLRRETAVQVRVCSLHAHHLAVWGGSLVEGRREWGGSQVEGNNN